MGEIRSWRIPWTEVVAYTHGYPPCPGDRPDYHWNALRIAASRGLDLTRAYIFWCPDPDDDGAVRIDQRSCSTPMRSTGNSYVS